MLSPPSSFYHFCGNAYTLFLCTNTFVYFVEYSIILASFVFNRKMPWKIENNNNKKVSITETERSIE